MNTAPLISVIVPVYKAEFCLEHCVDSVLGQDYGQVEVLLVDDGSPDDSGKICDELAAKDNRVKSFHKENGGPAAARNLALAAAKGELIFFLDADDLLPPEAFSLLVRDYVATGADMVVGTFSRFSGTSAPVPAAPSFSSNRVLSKGDIAEYAFSYLLAPNRNILFAYSWGRLFRASIIRDNALRFDASLHTFEDVAFNFEFLKHSANVSFVGALAYMHRTYDTFSSATMSIGGGLKRMFGYRSAIRAITSFLNTEVPGPKVAAAAGHANVSLTIIQLVRVCAQINEANRAEIYALVRDVVSEEGFQSDLRHYSPSGKDSRLLPLLMRLRLYRLIMAVCRYKAYKRYGIRSSGVASVKK